MKAKQVDFISSISPSCPQGGRKFPDQSGSDPGTGGHRIGLGTERSRTRAPQLFRYHRLRQENVWWKGEGNRVGRPLLRFRVYDTPQDSFMDYARLIRSVYPFAADVSDDPKAFARKIAYSKYISEVNGDNRAAIKRCWSRFAEKSVNSFPTHKS